ncbi:phosphoglucomutase/phosphomannomutase PgmG [Novosphingobium humi]|uniref:phosphoglucomutase/phosphomannomutase PgmG n=1 Tax=Novosphingobium humi TaxID=2282397 RepID=UPI0025B190AF|nr:phosphomannomutase/phosphoglucomutase [Novosphingobium humi]WJS98853.1 phosphomannomutase/phosphoglucomutase [Novosphingobium humi]
MTDPAIFREYDIRGTYGRNLFDDDAYAIGRAVAQALRAQGGRRIAVGRDGRLSAPALEAALVDGLCEGGLDVVRIGVGATPMLYYAEASMQEVDGGIHVTGSHNPRDDNGFKIVFFGGALFGAEIQRIGLLAADVAAAKRSGVAGELGAGEGVVGEWIGVDLVHRGAVEGKDVLPAYVARLVDGLLPGLWDKAGDLRIGWDAGNGAAGPAIDALTALLPGEHHLLFTQVDGHFPHHHPDPTVEANLADLRALVASRHLDFGVAFDGDADRLVVIDGRGRSILGDQLLALLAQDLLLDCPGAVILGDVKASQAVYDRIAALGGVPAMGPAGHSLIKAEMKVNGAMLAGETSGHIFYKHRFYGFDDALYAAVRLIAAVSRRNGSIADWFDELPVCFNTPELRFPVAANRKRAVVEEVAARLAAQGARVNRMDGLRVSCDDGWWLLRASNTQEMLVARAESTSEAGLAALVAQLDAELAQSGVSRSGASGV